MTLNVGQIVTEAEVEGDAEERKGERPRPAWERQALLRILDEQVRRDAMRTAALDNDD